MKRLLLLLSASMLLFMMGCREYNPFYEAPNPPVEQPTQTQVYVPPPAPAEPMHVSKPVAPTLPIAPYVDSSMTAPAAQTGQGAPAVQSTGTPMPAVDTRPAHQRPNPSHKPTPKPLNI